jgi:hypothetical protein
MNHSHVSSTSNASNARNLKMESVIKNGADAIRSREMSEFVGMALGLTTVGLALKFIPIAILLAAYAAGGVLGAKILRDWWDKNHPVGQMPE